MACSKSAEFLKLGILNVDDRGVGFDVGFDMENDKRRSEARTRLKLPVNLRSFVNGTGVDLFSLTGEFRPAKPKIKIVVGIFH